MGNTILFVDDEELILKALKAIFSREGFEALTVTSGEEALKVLEHEDVDVVVSDERMPGITGTELLALVKEKYPDKIRIVLTAYAELNTMLSAINKAEAHQLIIKPYSNDAFVQTVRGLMARQEQIRTRQKALETAKEESDFAYRATKIMCSQGIEVNEKYSRLVTLVKEYIRARTLSLMLVREEQKELVVQAATNRKILGMRRPLHDNAISCWVAREGRAYRHGAAQEDASSPEVPLHDQRLTRYQNNAFLSVPIMDENQILGVFNVADPEEGSISCDTEESVSHLMRWVGAMLRYPSLAA